MLNGHRPVLVAAPAEMKRPRRPGLAAPAGRAILSPIMRRPSHATLMDMLMSMPSPGAGVNLRVGLGRGGVWAILSR